MAGGLVRGKLIAVIGDEDTCTGFLLGGIGELNKNRKPNFLVVEKETSVTEIEETFRFPACPSCRLSLIASCSVCTTFSLSPAWGPGIGSCAGQAPLPLLSLVKTGIEEERLPPGAGAGREHDGSTAAYKSFLQREDIGIILINQFIAEMIRHAIDAHNVSIPAVLEIPSKEHPYDANKDSILRRAKGMFTSDDLR
ncbi:V-type proton ATPase subunit F isoform X1 [Dendrobates tinctorius]|uniref:V-type proton ATPase subunit F isoform X1 n=1 Tax=Dendrobates tinctorius TaxID=92724 RepID=UPI003CC975A7